LQKHRFFCRLGALIFAFHSTWRLDMTTFWKSLAQVAQGQLFIGGYLSPAAVAELARRVEPPCKAKRNGGSRDHLPWPRLAMPH
jgi:hypothetical protein